MDHANKNSDASGLWTVLRLYYILSRVALPSLSKLTAEGTAALNLVRPIRETTCDIFRVVTSTWLSGVLAGIDEYLGGGDLPDLDIELDPR